MRNPFIKIILFLIITTTLWMMGSADVCAQKSKKRKKKKEKEEVVTTEKTLRLSEQFFTEGEKHFILEDLARSLAFFEKSLELNPQNNNAKYMLKELQKIE